MNIKINGDLFQWEKNRIVFIDFNEDKTRQMYAQIFNYKCCEAPLIPIVDNKITIPDHLLEQPYPITVIICDETQVLTRKEFRILKRPKPKGYSEEHISLTKLNNLIGGDI